MKYVGATNGFIRWPFVIEGMLLGFIGSIIAVLCVGEFYHFITIEVSDSLAFFPLVPMFPLLSISSMLNWRWDYRRLLAVPFH